MINFAQTALAVDIVSILRPVAIRSCPLDNFDQVWPFLVEQMQGFVFQPLETGRRDIVFRRCG